MLLTLKGKVCTSYMLSYLTYGSETLSMKVEHELNLDRTEMSLIIWVHWIKRKMQSSDRCSD